MEELQSVLESLEVGDRLSKALIVLKKELINAQLQSKLSRDVDTKIAKRQREYYLTEQLKNIKKELGLESDGKDKLMEKFRSRAKGLKMPAEVEKVFEEEMSKLNGLEQGGSEANVTRNYLEWLTQVCTFSFLIKPLTLCRVDTLGSTFPRKFLGHTRSSNARRRPLRPQRRERPYPRISRRWQTPRVGPRQNHPPRRTAWRRQNFHRKVHRTSSR